MTRDRNKNFHLLLAALTLGLAACADDQAGFGGGGGGTGGTAAPTADQGPGATQPPAGGGQSPVSPEFPDATIARPECNAYDFRGQTFDCTALDRCTEQDLQYRLACCECDSRLCDPDPTCAPVGGGQPGAGGGEPPPGPNDAAESCMGCHNGAVKNDYSGPGLSNPHPFKDSDKISCTGCHGGNGRGIGKNGSHVPPPPAIGDRQRQATDPKAFFNRRTLAGIDKLEPAEYQDAARPGESFSNIDYLQFVNPGDLRVVTEGRGCGAQGCHFNKHAQWFPRGLIATETGFWSTTHFIAGIENAIPEHRGRDKDGDSLADTAFRAISNPNYNADNRNVGEVGRLVEVQEKAQYDGPMRDNPLYDAPTLQNYLTTAVTDPERPNRVIADSPLHMLLDAQVTITCGDCHAGSAGQNDRFADFRSSGCTACHMEYSYDGRSRSNDPNVPRNEPANPDAIAAGERSHVETHQIRNVAKVLPNGGFLRGIGDHACVGCHQGSNRTVLQYWGIRLDQNADLANNQQYPANPVTFQNTAANQKLFDPAVANNTFNGRNANQYIEVEDYDGDGRDDTPADVHFDSGMGCIDCHGSRDLHNGADGDPDSGRINSRTEQQVKIRCENCHGTIEAYPATKDCTDYNGGAATCAVDESNNALRNVTRDPTGELWLTSRLDGRRHYIPLTKDVVGQNNKRHPVNSNLLYNPKAAYAMGRIDGDPTNGIGPVQNNPNLSRQGFAHTDSMECVSCHASWSNNCIGCHLRTQYDANPNNYFFSNVTGERILLKQQNADFTYITPVPMYLGINTRGKITQTWAGMKVFYGFIDRNGTASQVLSFTDRLGEGNNPNNLGRNAFPALHGSQMMAHSIRGKVGPSTEGPRYCVSCHLNQEQIANFGAQYDTFRTNYANNNLAAALDFNLLKQHIGQNPGNQLNSPFFVHMAAGLGSGMFLFDANGCPVNPLDNNANRKICNDGAPAANFNLNNVRYDADRLVQANGIPNVSSGHPRTEVGAKQRVGATNAEMGGPLDAGTIQKLADPTLGKVLDSWIDANGAAQGGAANYLIQ
jgi:hypothetical protein